MTVTDLIIYPQDFTLFLKIILVPIVFEVIRIIFGYSFVGQSSQIAKLEKEKLQIQYELSTIKSIQLELVRHSKLERNLIKIDKEIEKLKASQIPKEKKMKSYFQIGRLLVYVAAGIFFSAAPVVLISPKVFWPFGWIFFTSNETIGIHPWFLILIVAASSRHLLRTFLLLFAPANTFP
eukprot:gene1193-1266_t